MVARHPTWKFVGAETFGQNGIAIRIFGETYSLPGIEFGLIAVKTRGWKWNLTVVICNISIDLLYVLVRYCRNVQTISPLLEPSASYDEDGHQNVYNYI